MKKIGVIVARFQVNHLHEGHIALVEHVRTKCEQLHIILGVSQSQFTKSNPLGVKAREEMVKASYPDAIVHHLWDHKSDEEWSKNLDKIIGEKINEHDDEVVLFGSRESFLNSYSGKYSTEHFNSDIPHISAKNIRQTLFEERGNTKEWRSGVIYASGNRYPVSYQCTDTAIVNFATNQILLGKKDGEKKFRFIGGFVDVNDLSLEFSAKREVSEECGNIETDDYRYIGSYKIDDWRYRDSQDRIMTALFICRYIYGAVEATDDITELHWVDLKDLESNMFEPEHAMLHMELVFYLSKLRLQ